MTMYKRRPSRERFDEREIAEACNNPDIPLYISAGNDELEEHSSRPPPTGHSSPTVRTLRKVSPERAARSPSPMAMMRRRSRKSSAALQCAFILLRYGVFCTLLLGLFGYTNIFSAGRFTVFGWGAKWHGLLLSIGEGRGENNNMTHRKHSRRQVQEENERLTKDLVNMQSALTRAEAEVNKLHREHEIYTHIMDVLREENERLAAQHEYDEENDNEVVRLREEIQKISRAEVIRRFGPGPHRVEFELKFPPSAPPAPDDTYPTTFVLELAPLDLMPHAVYTFLHMLENGLWVDVTGNEKGEKETTAISLFNELATHVVLAGPLPRALHNYVERGGIASMSFSEFTTAFDHHKYTVGFAGKPLPGPHFYISLDDNRSGHFGEPCFGRIVSGFDTVDRLSSLREEGNAIDPPVEIVLVALLREPGDRPSK